MIATQQYYLSWNVNLVRQQIGNHLYAKPAAIHVVAEK